MIKSQKFIYCFFCIYAFALLFSCSRTVSHFNLNTVIANLAKEGFILEEVKSVSPANINRHRSINCGYDMIIKYNEIAHKVVVTPNGQISIHPNNENIKKILSEGFR